MALLTRPCPSCRRTLVGRARTDGSGRLVEEWPRCACERDAAPLQLQPDELTYEERAAAARKTGICMDCDLQVEGRVGWALRCAEHKRRAKQDASNASHKTPKGLARRRRSERKRRRDRAWRERRNARRRELHQERMAGDLEYAAAYRRRRQRETLLSNPSRAKYMETQRQHNADPVRAERKREQARRRYHELHPERPDPHCMTCGEAIAWTPGHGRPPKYHQTAECNPRHRYSASAPAAAPSSTPVGTLT